MPGVFSRVKTWINETLNASDLNNEFDNIISNFEPLKVDDYSSDVSQMQVETDPYPSASASQATTLAGELARLRYQVTQITGESNWYVDPDTNINSINTNLNSVATIPSSRIVSGKTRSNGNFPAFLLPTAAANTATLDATTPSLVTFVNGTSYTLSADVVTGSISSPATSNNTCLVNDSDLTANLFMSKFIGEEGGEIAVDTMGSSVSTYAGNGKHYAFKLAGAATEYFIAQVKSSTALSDIRRGYFFDSSGDPIARTTFSNNSTITLMSMAFVFLKNDGTVELAHRGSNASDRAVTYAATAPSGTSGDFWYDVVNKVWMKHDGASFVAYSGLLVGIAISDGTTCVGARSENIHTLWSPYNTINLEKLSASVVTTTDFGQRINVAGSTFDFTLGKPNWDMTANLESGVTEAASTRVYFYITDGGDPKISTHRPYVRGDMMGLYHPYRTWRCVGEAFNDSGSDLQDVKSYLNKKKYLKFTEELSSGSSTAASTGATYDNRPLTILRDSASRSYVIAATDGTGDHGEPWAYLASNAVHLDPGVYQVYGSAFFGGSGTYKIKIRNATASSDLIIGQSVGTGGASRVLGSFELTSRQAITLMMYSQNAGACASPVSAGDVEVSAILEVEKIK